MLNNKRKYLDGIQKEQQKIDKYRKKKRSLHRRKYIKDRQLLSADIKISELKIRKKRIQVSMI